MIDVVGKLIFSNADTTGSTTLSVAQGEVLTLQIDGEFTGLSLAVQGVNNPTSDDSYSLMGYNLTTFGTTSVIEGNGLYQFPVGGLYQIQVNITNISSGTVSVFARISKGG